MSKVSVDDRRTLIALMCRVAWADGIIEEAEREYVQGLIVRLGGEPVGPAELDSWLKDGVPPELLKPLPETLEQFFFYEALRLAEADGDLDPREQEVLEGIMHRVFEPHEDSVTLTQIARIRIG
jgi:tellurite resistance protein